MTPPKFEDRVGRRARRRSVLGEEDRRALRARLERAVRRARRAGTANPRDEHDRALAGRRPSAVACASRRPHEPWFALEQPDRGGSGARDARRGRETERRGQRAVRDLGRALAPAGRGRRRRTSASRLDQLAGEAPIAVCGFAFAPDGGGSPAWAGFDPASLVVPEVAIRRSARPRGGDEPNVRLTLAALVAPDDTASERLERLEARVSGAAARPAGRRAGGRRASAAAAARPGAERALSGGQRDAARALRGRGRAGDRADRARHVWKRSCSPARCRCMLRARMTRAPCSGSCATPSRDASASAWGAAMPRSSRPVPSCWCVAKGTG